MHIVTEFKERLLIEKVFPKFDFIFFSKTSQFIFDLHPGFSHLEDEKGNKLRLFKKYFKMMFFYYTSHHWSLLLFILIAFCVTKAFAKKN